jgi:hypothetical protein
MSIKRQKIENKINVYNLSNDIIKYIFTFLNKLYHIKILPHVSKQFNEFIKDHRSWCKSLNITLKSQLTKNLKNMVVDCRFENVLCFLHTELPTNYFLWTKELTLYDFSHDHHYIKNEYIFNLSKLQNLVKLDICFCDSLTDECIDSLLEIKTLETIKLIYCHNITNKGLCKLATMPLKQLSIDNDKNDLSYLENMNISKLETISISNKNLNNKKYVENFIERIQTHSKELRGTIKSVEFSSIGDDDMLLKLLCLEFKKIRFYELYNSIKGYFITEFNFRNLENFILYKTNIENDHLVQLLNSTIKLKFLRLIFSKLDTRDTDELVNGFSNLVSLEGLDMSACIIKNKLIEILQNTKINTLCIRDCVVIGCENIKKLKSLRHLNINGINDDFLIHIRDLKLTNLSLEGSNITGDGLKYLVNMPLRYLNLSRTNVVDENLIHIKYHKLEELSLSFCFDITPSCLAFFKTMQLESLRLYGCNNIKNNDIEFFGKLDRT